MRPRAHPRYVRGWNRLTMKVRFKLSRVGAGQHARGQQRDGRSQAARHFYRFKLDTCMVGFRAASRLSKSVRSGWQRGKFGSGYYQ